MPAVLSIHKFWTTYVQDPADASKLLEIDHVAYGPIGSLDKTVIPDTIARLQKLQPLEGSQNPAVHMAHARWAAIEPAYKAWKAGQEAPINGTPLAAWNALTPEQAEVFKRNDIKTVEDISMLTDAHISRFPLPGLKELIKQAKNFIDAAEQTRFSAKLTEKDHEIATLRAENQDRDSQVNELMEKVKALAELVAAQQQVEEASEPGSEPARRGPGRPRKDQAEAA